MITVQERNIVDKLLKRDEKSLIDFYNANKKMLFNFIYRQLDDSYLAEEITQDTFLDFIDALAGFKFRSGLRTFLFTIAKNKVIDAIRKKKIKKIVFSALPFHIVESLGSVIFDEEIEKKELAQKIKLVFDQLPNDYRVVLRLKYIEGEPVAVIAKKLSMKFKATESLIFRARKAFVKLYVKYSDETI